MRLLIRNFSLSYVGLFVVCLPSLADYVPIANPQPILNDWPANSSVNWREYIRPISSSDYNRYEGPALVNSSNGNLLVRSWNYMPNVPGHNTPGIVETLNTLRSNETALIVVHPWGIEDGQGWQGPQAYNCYGYAFCGLLEDNLLANTQMREIAKPFIDNMRSRLAVIGYSLPGTADATRSKIYRDYDSQPTEASRAEGQAEIESYLGSLTGTQWPTKIPVNRNLACRINDVVIYDDLGYDALKNFLTTQGIKNILLAGYCTDMCVISTTAGYQNLTRDFNVFLIGDMTLSAWPITTNPPNGYQRHPTTDELIIASQYQGSHPIAITQTSWITPVPEPGVTIQLGILSSAILALHCWHTGNILWLSTSGIKK